MRAVGPIGEGGLPHPAAGRAKHRARKGFLPYLSPCFAANDSIIYDK